LKLPCRGEVYLFVDQGSSGARAGQTRLWHFGKRRQSVLDIAVGQRQMELRDGLKALELVREIVGKIAEQSVDELYKIVALVCRNSDQIIKNLVIAFRMKLRPDGGNALGLRSLEANGVPDDS